MCGNKEGKIPCKSPTEGARTWRALSRYAVEMPNTNSGRQADPCTERNRDAVMDDVNFEGSRRAHVKDSRTTVQYASHVRPGRSGMAELRSAVLVRSRLEKPSLSRALVAASRR